VISRLVSATTSHQSRKCRKHRTKPRLHGRGFAYSAHRATRDPHALPQRKSPAQVDSPTQLDTRRSMRSGRPAAPAIRPSTMIPTHTQLPRIALLGGLLAATALSAQDNTAAAAAESPARPAASDGDIVVLDPMTVVGTGIALPTIKYPGSVTVVALDDLAARADIVQSLSLVPGFETGNDNGRSLGQQYSIRGFGYGTEDRVIVELDGVRRSTSLYSNQVSSFRVDSDLLKEVEVVKGASSIFHGGGAIGGVVGMTTKDAADFVQPGHTTGAVVKGRYDTNNLREARSASQHFQRGRIPDLVIYYKQGLKGDLTLAEDLPLTAGGTYDTVDNREELSTLFLKSGWDFAPGQRLSVSYLRYHEDTEVTWQSLYPAATAPSPVRCSANSTSRTGSPATPSSPKTTTGSISTPPSTTRRPTTSAATPTPPPPARPPTSSTTTATAAGA
jgi:outer membrane receptor protein involved in Fe transport